ncbi:MAG: tetratricopeptide repeat protein [Pseudomonadota bacterium]|nr:tetratricopeptide repeat protein [Pseudomonadota bacterium]
MAKTSPKTQLASGRAPAPPQAGAPAHLSLAQTLAAVGRRDEAIAAYEAAIHSDPAALDAYFGLARALLSAGRAAEAFRRADEALALDMDNSQAWTLIGEALDALGETILSTSAFERAQALDPEAAEPLARLGAHYLKLDRPFEAAARYQRALTLAPAAATRIEAHVALSALHGRALQFGPARAHAEAALLLAPEHQGAHQNLAAVCDHEGRDDEAEAHRERAYRRSPLIVARAPHPRRRVLTLASAARANSPDAYLIPPTRYDRLIWFIAYADEALSPQHDYDVVFNAVGDPDAAAALAERLAEFVARCRRPVLNRPERIAATARDNAARLFEGINDLVAPPTRRITQGAQIDDAEPEQLWLLRPLGSHGGERLQRLARGDIAARLDGSAHYATAFHEFRSGDGLYRKYRMFFVDRAPFPYHLAIHDDWLVHYQTSRTASDAALIAEERRFLENPAAAIGARAYGAICAIGRRMDLDFAGVDFAVLPDGRALLFEANATMLVHPEASDGPLAHKNPFVSRILEAFWARLEAA